MLSSLFVSNQCSILGLFSHSIVLNSKVVIRKTGICGPTAGTELKVESVLPGCIENTARREIPEKKKEQAASAHYVD